MDITCRGGGAPLLQLPVDGRTHPAHQLRLTHTCGTVHEDSGGGGSVPTRPVGALTPTPYGSQCGR